MLDQLVKMTSHFGTGSSSMYFDDVGLMPGARTRMAKYVPHNPVT